MSPLPHILLASSGARRWQERLWAGIAGFLKATVGRARGDLDDHAQLDRDLGRRVALRRRRPAAERDADRPCRSRTTSRTARSCRSSGARSGCRASTSASSSRWPRSSSSGSILNRTTLGLRGARGRLQPGSGRLRRDQREEEPDPRDGDLRRVRRARRRARHDRLPVPLRPDPTSRSRRSASSASRSRCWAATPPSGTGIAALLFGALLFGTTHGLTSNVIDP